MKKILILCLCTGTIFAKVNTPQQQHLKNNLTPFGAIKNGNGKQIPVWQEQTNKTTNTKDDAILFTITHDNYQNYSQNLSAGQLALFENYKHFAMPIYPTRRTASAPKWVYKNTYDNALTTTLNEKQSGFENYHPGIPFPLPQNALEVYFNHVSRWRGLQTQTQNSDAVIYANGTFTLYTKQTLIRYDGYLPSLKSKYFISLVAKVLAPATQSGGGILVREPLDQLHEKRASWLWDKGRRRVIRAPNVAYDSPVQSASGLRTVDDTDLINGSPDRFTWKMLEKRELYIPYNNDKLASKQLKYKDILQKQHINPNFTRYELHRVWVIAATLKEKWRHVYSKRVFYIDEDSWQVMLADQYNKQGKLWRVSLSYSKFYQQLPGIYPVLNVYHELNSQKYHVMGLQNEERTTIKFNGEIAKNNIFTPSGFKRYMR